MVSFDLFWPSRSLFRSTEVTTSFSYSSSLLNVLQSRISCVVSYDDFLIIFIVLRLLPVQNPNLLLTVMSLGLDRSRLRYYLQEMSFQYDQSLSLPMISFPPPPECCHYCLNYHLLPSSSPSPKHLTRKDLRGTE
eukprot:gb/GEZJ01003748.1/.p1 GENE.gb/GEZJ01003748.1/~~gb/GEZJ01003748.1/.p1  ORF type:complete len:135 (+),score=12.38 gb/GEZJ01003748.1/:166-570(+)